MVGWSKLVGSGFKLKNKQRQILLSTFDVVSGWDAVRRHSLEDRFFSCVLMQTKARWAASPSSDSWLVQSGVSVLDCCSLQGIISFECLSFMVLALSLVMLGHRLWPPQQHCHLLHSFKWTYSHLSALLWRHTGRPGSCTFNGQAGRCYHVFLRRDVLIEPWSLGNEQKMSAEFL